MQVLPEYDVAVVGGGLAGLAASILLKKKNYRVILFEKEHYPFHRVCGEYISLESWNFLLSLGLPLHQWNLPHIDTLQLSAPGGQIFETGLPLGGFGISRYTLDNALADLAKAAGVHLLEGAKVAAIEHSEGFTVRWQQHSVKASLCFAAYGKRSNLDVKWNRPFLQKHHTALNNFVGVKYHVQASWPQNLIGLHNFKDGYCGVSKVEGDRYCLCYLTRAKNLKNHGNRIDAMQKAVLFQNPRLKAVFENSAVLPDFPVVISQISFAQKSRVENGVLMLGDTAGMITPLCGNGMSIALHTAKLAAVLGDQFLQKKITAGEMEKRYRQQWNQQFARRLRAGRALQYFFGNSRLSNFFVGTFRLLPILAKPFIRLTHGRPF